MQVALVCNSAFGTDGISMFVMNNHRFFGHENVRYHLIYSSIHSLREVVDGYVQDWCKDGDKSLFISKGNGALAFAINFYRYLKQEKIDVLHVHGSSAAILLEMIMAKLAGVKKIATHSHNTQGNHNTIHKILRPLVNLFADERLACGYKAGQWMYGKKKKFTVIPNCIDTSRYLFDERFRTEARSELGIEENCIVLGHVGMFTEVKNQKFLLQLMHELGRDGKCDFKLMLIGDGELLENAQKEAKQLSISNNVLFLGCRNDVPRLMMAMDVFCMPSLYEGFPITAVEAQATGLPLLMSDNVSLEVNITDLVKLLPIDQGTELWEKEIKQASKTQHERKSYADRIKAAGYDIIYSAEMLEQIYRKNIDLI